MTADQIVVALLESDDVDPQDYALSNLSVPGILEADGFKPVEDAAQTFYRYIPVNREMTYGGKQRVTALLVLASWHPPKNENTRDELEKIFNNGMLQITWQFVMQPKGWEAGTPVGRRFSFHKYVETERQGAGVMHKAMRVINNVMKNAQGVTRPLACDAYHTSIKSGLMLLGDVNNAD